MYQQEKTPKNLKYNNKVKEKKENITNEGKQPSK